MAQRQPFNCLSQRLHQQQQLPRSVHVRAGRQKNLQKIILCKKTPFKFPERKEKSEVWKCPKTSDSRLRHFANFFFARNEFFGGAQNETKRKVGDNFCRRTNNELFREKDSSFFFGCTETPRTWKN